MCLQVTQPKSKHWLIPGFVGLPSDRFDDGIRRNASMDQLQKAQRSCYLQQNYK